MASINPPSVNPVPAGANISKPRAKHIITRLHRWIIYCLAISLVQPIAHMLYSLTFNKSFELFDLFAHGEVPLICLAIVSSSILDLLNTDKPLGTLGNLVLSISNFISVFSAIWFGSFAFGEVAINTSGLNNLTFIWYSSSLFISMISQIIVTLMEM